ncbi:MAG: hypothetical protein DWG81_03500 [Chloroflexi bacterium]|nr:hypothetical protein [Chloroflexota bacterium]
MLWAWRWHAVIVMKRSCISLCGQPQSLFVSFRAARLTPHARCSCGLAGAAAGVAWMQFAAVAQL